MGLRCQPVEEGMHVAHGEIASAMNRMSAAQRPLSSTRDGLTPTRSASEANQHPSLALRVSVVPSLALRACVNSPRGEEKPQAEEFPGAALCGELTTQT